MHVMSESEASTGMFLGTYTKSQKVTICFVMSVCSHSINELILDGFS